MQWSLVEIYFCHLIALSSHVTHLMHQLIVLSWCVIWVWCSVSDLSNGTLNPHLGLHATQDCSTPHQMTGSATRWQSYGCTDTNKWFVRWAANRDSLMLRPVLSQLKLQWTWFWLKYNLLLCSFPQFVSFQLTNLLLWVTVFPSL